MAWWYRKYAPNDRGWRGSKRTTRWPSGVYRPAESRQRLGHGEGVMACRKRQAFVGNSKSRVYHFLIEWLDAIHALHRAVGSQRTSDLFCTKVVLMTVEAQGRDVGDPIGSPTPPPAFRSAPTRAGNHTCCGRRGIEGVVLRKFEAVIPLRYCATGNQIVLATHEVVCA